MLGVILSQPDWPWGCEMKSNEHGAVEGNDDVSTLLTSELDTNVAGGGLLGMNLLRLSLERGCTVQEAMEIHPKYLCWRQQDNVTGPW
eukprot:10398466-Ditylum_brightwellii.AAC.1